MPRKDPYQILGVARTASQDEIRRAYRKLAKEHHPDRNAGNKSAEQRFKDLQAAYEIVGDPDRRAQYDRFGEGGPAPDVHTWSSTGRSPFSRGGGEVRFDDGDDLGSLFEQFFSRGGGASTRSRRRAAPARPAPAPGADLEHSVELTFEEAARGCARDVRLSGGGGVEHITFRVPAGVADGQRIRVRGKGHEGAGGRGDLMVLCRIRPHAYFRREGLDVYLDLPLTFGEASLGTRVEIPTLDGSTWLTVPPGASSGTKLRLRGKGIFDARQEQQGDYFAVVKIVAPRDASPRAHELIEQLERELSQRPREDLGWRLQPTPRD